MKLILTVLLFGICCYNHAQEFTKDSLEIVGIMKMQENCWNEGNIDCFMNGYWRSDSLKFIGKSGITYGWDQTLTNYKSKYPDKFHMGVLRFKNLHMTKQGNEHITVIGSWNLERDKGPIGGFYTLLWKKIKGSWLIVSDHSS